MAMPSPSSVSRCTLAPPSSLALACSPSATRSRSAAASGPAALTSRTRWGLPIPTRSARATGPPVHSGASPSTAAAPIAAHRLSVTASIRSPTVTTRSPASVSIVSALPGSLWTPGQPRTRAWPRQRMPLPLISAADPSALRSSMRTRPGDPTVGVARMMPSAPTPEWRSHRVRAMSGSSGWDASGSSRIRKSLPRPWCLVRRMSPASLPDRAAPDSRLSPRPHPLGQCREQGLRTGVGVEPRDARVPPEPRALPAGEPAGAPDRQLDRLVQVPVAGEVVDQLGVPERLARGARHAPGLGEQATDLVEEAGGHLRLVALLDPAGHDLVGHGEPDQGERGRRVHLQPRAVGRE